MTAPEARRLAPRAQIAMTCTLRRPTGSPIPVRTLNVGPGGMLVSSPRPLAIDETVDFALAELEADVSGLARVLRQQHVDVYALRFERLPAPMTRRLRELASAGADASEPRYST